MSLADKMFDRVKPGCGFGTDCHRQSNRKFFGELFAQDWDVLVIRHDEEKSKYNWFTLCCEAANEKCNAKPLNLATACC